MTLNLFGALFCSFGCGGMVMAAIVEKIDGKPYWHLIALAASQAAFVAAAVVAL